MNKLQIDIGRFARPRVAGDADYVSAITEMFAQMGHPDPQAWERTPRICAAVEMAPAAQCVAVTRHWHAELGKMKRDTQSERMCLGEVDMEPADYLKLFKEHVAPTIVLAARGELHDYPDSAAG